MSYLMVERMLVMNVKHKEIMINLIGLVVLKGQVTQMTP